VHGNGRSLDEAKERALEQLGVAESDAEFEVLSEPKPGLFGRMRGEALVKARVRPVELRPKRQRRQRERPRATDGPGRAQQKGPASGASAGGTRASDRREQDDSASGSDGSSRSGASRRRRGSRGSGSGGANATTGSNIDGVSENDRHSRTATWAGEVNEEAQVADGVTLQEQAEVAREFLEGLLDRYELEAAVEIRELDGETVELAATGEGLGVLVGPRGATIAALQDVTRTVVQRRFPNRTDRILVDVAGYRERRIAALRRFSDQVAGEVRSSGTEQALEPMSAADRKAVHDAIGEIDGVVSRSEGEDPYRYVVIALEG
jgi:spoIIIJ-associated protein